MRLGDMIDRQIVRYEGQLAVAQFGVYGMRKFDIGGYTMKPDIGLAR